MDVHTYYEPLNHADADEIVQLWRTSWERQGWQAKVLTRDAVLAHPLYEPLLAKVQTMPTVNSRDYEVACYLRWLAMVAVGGGLMVDIDVVNVGQPPCALPEGLCCWEDDRCPCCVSGSAEDFTAVVQWFLDWDGHPQDQLDGRPHTSDMYIFKSKQPRTLGKCRDIACRIDEPLVHCSHHGSHHLGLTQLEAMRKVIGEIKC
jgi:hypothetical protein